MASEENPVENPNSVILYIRASQIDKKSKGSCPTSQQYFLASYVLHQKDFFNLVVKTVYQSANNTNEPEDYLRLTSKKLPLIYIEKGTDLADMEYEDIENFLDIWNCKEMAIAKNSPEERQAERVIENLYRNFNAFLRDSNHNPSLLLASLEKLNNHLAKTADTKFLLCDELCYADCQLIPKLHHLIVACKAYKGFQIPDEYVNVWQYLAEVYKTDAFDKSCPTDEDIIKHYETKAKPSINVEPILGKVTYTRNIPESVVNGQNGS